MIPEVIFFDKDGTLIDFDAFWISVSRHAVGDVLMRYSSLPHEDKIEEILSALGVKDGKTDIDGILCKGTYEQIAEVVYKFLQKPSGDFEKIKTAVLNAYNENMDKGCVRGACDNIAEVLAELKNKGIRLCVVTTDNPQITAECLEKLGVADLFECVYTDDGKIPPKPDSACIDDYCAKTGISRDKMLMVGDTITDVKFARNAGIRVICVGGGDLPADACVPDISYIIDGYEVL